jgi:hypothetical protein
MLVYIPGVGYTSSSFHLNGVRYPRNWLDNASPADLAAIGAVPRPQAGADEVVVTDPGGWVVRPMTAEEIAARDAAAAAAALAAKEVQVTAAWKHYDALAMAAADHNSRGRYLAWLIDPAASATKRTRIAEVQTWMDILWLAYSNDKAAILAGTFTDYSFAAGPCPWTFWDIAGA